MMNDPSGADPEGGCESPYYQVEQKPVVAGKADEKKGEVKKEGEKKQEEKKEEEVKKNAYYNKDGTFLGFDDNSKDDKVFVADSKNEQGGFENSVELSGTHTDFKYIAGVIRSEDSSSFEGAAATTQATFNAVKLVKGDNTALSDQSKYAAQLLATGYSSVPNKKALSESKIGQSDLNARKGLIHVLQSGEDYSKGAVAWDGFDLAIKGSTHPKAKDGGFSVSESLWNDFTAKYDWTINKGAGIKYNGTYYPSAASLTFTNSVFEIEGSGKYTKGNVLYKATAVYGQHLFWAPNKDEVRNIGYNMKGLNSFLK